MNTNDPVAKVEAERRVAAGAQLAHWHFGPFTVKDTGGWGFGGQVWNCPVLLEIEGQQDSVKVNFQVIFQIGTAVVTSCGASFVEGQKIGHPRK